MLQVNSLAMVIQHVVYPIRLLFDPITDCIQGLHTAVRIPVYLA